MDLLPVGLYRLRLVAGGPAVDPEQLALALQRLMQTDPSLSEVGYRRDQVAIAYTEEAAGLSEAVRLAHRMWQTWRGELALPGWRLLELGHDDTEPAPGPSIRLVRRLE